LGQNVSLAKNLDNGHIATTIIEINLAQEMEIQRKKQTKQNKTKQQKNLKSSD